MFFSFFRIPSRNLHYGKQLFVYSIRGWSMVYRFSRPSKLTEILLNVHSGAMGFVCALVCAVCVYECMCCSIFAYVCAFVSNANYVVGVVCDMASINVYVFSVKRWNVQTWNEFAARPPHSPPKRGTRLRSPNRPNARPPSFCSLSFHIKQTAAQGGRG